MATLPCRLSSGRWLTILIVVAAWVMASCVAWPAWGHTWLTNEGTLADAQTPDEWLAHRWSWVHVWESGRHWQPGWSPRFPLPELPPQADAATMDALRQSAVTALLGATRPGRPSSLRQQAALALGRIGTEQAAQGLLALLNDKDDALAEVAWMAMGLCHADIARDRLLDPGTLNVRQTLGWIVAIAIMEDPPENALRTLAALVKQPRAAEVSRLAWWALRQRAPNELTDVARDVFRQSTDAEMVSEAILLLGSQKHNDLLGQFRTVLASRGPGLIALSAHIHQFLRHNLAEAQVNRLSAEMSAVSVAAAMALGQYELPPEDRYGQRARQALRLLYESPPLPLVPASVQSPPRLYSSFAHSGGLPYEIRFAALEMGRIGHAEEVDLLARIVRTNHLQDARGRSIQADHFTRRGMAAMGLGLYLRRMTLAGLTLESTEDAGHVSAITGDRALWRRGGPLYGEQPQQTRQALRKAARTLLDMASDPEQPYALRAASLMAMGLSYSPARRDDIRAVLAMHDKAAHPLMTAYGVLALAILGDPHTPAMVHALLPSDRPTHPDPAAVLAMRYAERLSPGDILALNTLLEALAIVQSPIGADVARQQFGREPWTSRQAILTLRKLNDTHLVEPLIRTLEHHPQMAHEDAQRRGVEKATTTDLSASQVAALAAWSLGHLLRPDADDKLAIAFHRQGNFTLPLAPLASQVAQTRQVNTTYRLRTLADPIFYEMLIPGLPVRHDLPFRY